MSKKRNHTLVACIAVAAVIAVSCGFACDAVAAAAPAQDFLLEQSARSGALCQAVRDYEDPAAQLRGARAWAVRCRGWEVALGHLYSFDRNAATAVADSGPWRGELVKRASCSAFQQANVASVSGTLSAECRSIPGGATYQAYQTVQGDGAVLADGFGSLNDVLEDGMRIVAGVASPPRGAEQVRRTGVTFTRQALEVGNFVATADAAEATAEFLSIRAYESNHRWLFPDAENDVFLTLTGSEVLSPSQRALAQLNFALNVSDQGRFEEAQLRFDQALATLGTVNDPVLDALALNYQSLHYLNQRRSEDARRTAQRAIQARADIQRAGLSARPAGSAVAAGEGLEITPVLAASLNERERIIGALGSALSVLERMKIQDAQAYYVIGMADLQASQTAAARMALAQADVLLADRRLARVGAWLRVRVFSALASLDMNDGNPAQARDRLGQAIQLLRLDPAMQGAPAEANLYLSLANAEAQSNMTEEAFTDYAVGFDLLRQSRGSLGDSADAFARYFDLLIGRVGSDPENARQYAGLFFDTAQSAVSSATAQTVSRLSARMAGAGGSAGVLERALEDLQREITIRRANIQRQQDSGMYPTELKTADDAAVTALRDREQAVLQQIIDSNPRYGQLVSETATLKSLQNALQPGEVYVKTVLLSSGGYGIAVTKEAAQIYAIPLSRAQAQAAVTTLRRPFDSARTLPRFDVAASYELFSKVFGPAQDQVRAARHVIYEPDGPLISFPAAAFVTDAASVAAFRARETRFLSGQFDQDLYQGLAWLGRSSDVSLSVSPTAFLQVRRVAPSKAARPFLGVGSPITSVSDPRMFSLLVDKRDPVRANACEQVRVSMVQGLPEFRGMDEMIRMIANRYQASPSDIILGTSFTDVGVRSRTDLANYRIVFFGTHGLLPNAGECLPEPALVTSLGAGDSDGFLEAAEILELGLDADLVVLAACNTGGVGAAGAERTGLMGSGEALGGLARDFIYAGGRTLVVSQWNVDQLATVELTNRFFAGGASSQANALRRAQGALMDNRAFSHPYYWAAFSLLGDGARPM